MTAPSTKALPIPTYDPATNRVFVTNSDTGAVDVLELDAGGGLTYLFSISVGDPNPGVPGDPLDGGDKPTSVVFTGGVLAVSVVADPETDPGLAALFNADGELLNAVQVGVLPDAITASPNGKYIVTSNEGQPNAENTIDPEGSVSVIDISGGVDNATVATADFTFWNSMEDNLRAAGVRIFGFVFEGDPLAPRPTTVAEDLEPEYATVAPTTPPPTSRSKRTTRSRWWTWHRQRSRISCRLASRITASKETASMPPTGTTRLARSTRNVLGMYHPDAIASYEANGKTYLVTANEGDARDYDGYSEEIRGGDILDDFSDLFFFEGKGQLKNDKMLGRLRTTTYPPLTAIEGTRKSGEQILSKLVAYGARSFSIWCAQTRALVYDSGDEFEQITLATVPDIFNASNDEPDADARSDDKGPEPEGVIVATIDGTPYAFITLERVGGVMVYDISDPANAAFSTTSTRVPPRTTPSTARSATTSDRRASSSSPRPTTRPTPCSSSSRTRSVEAPSSSGSTARLGSSRPDSIGASSSVRREAGVTPGLFLLCTPVRAHYLEVQVLSVPGKGNPGCLWNDHTAKAGFGWEEGRRFRRGSWR